MLSVGRAVGDRRPNPDGTTTAAVGTVPIAAAVLHVFIRVGSRRGSDRIPIIFVPGRVRVSYDENECRPTIGARSFALFVLG